MRRRIFITGNYALALSALLLLYTCSSSIRPVPMDYPVQKTLIQQKLINNQLPLTSVSVKADQKQVIQTPKKTKLSIPADAFRLKGKALPPDAEADIQIREVFDPIDYLVNGVSLSLDTAGVKGVPFISGGMVEVRASYQGQSLELAPGVSLQLEFIPPSQDSDFDIYVFNDQGQWQLQNDTDIQDKLYRKDSEELLIDYYNKKKKTSMTSDKWSTTTNKVETRYSPEQIKKSEETGRQLQKIRIEQFGLYNCDKIGPYRTITVNVPDRDPQDRLEVYVLGLRERFFVKRMYEGDRLKGLIPRDSPSLVMVLSPSGRMGFLKHDGSEDRWEINLSLIDVPEGVYQSPRTLQNYLGL